MLGKWQKSTSMPHFWGRLSAPEQEASSLTLISLSVISRKKVTPACFAQAAHNEALISPALHPSPPLPPGICDMNSSSHVLNLTVFLCFKNHFHLCMSRLVKFSVVLTFAEKLNVPERCDLSLFVGGLHFWPSTGGLCDT